MIEQAKTVAQRLRDHNTCHGEADTIDALIAALKEAQSECNEQARLLGMGAERELALKAEVERLTNVNDSPYGLRFPHNDLWDKVTCPTCNNTFNLEKQ